MKTDKKKEELKEEDYRSPGLISQKYFKKELISKINYGYCYKVENKKTKCQYLCKEICKNKIIDMTKFNTDIANILKAENTSNINKLIDVYEDENYIYLIIEEVKGLNLFQEIIEKINKGKVYDERLVSAIFKQVMTAISQCHQIGQSHKDINPMKFLFEKTFEEECKLEEIEEEKEREIEREKEKEREKEREKEEEEEKEKEKENKKTKTKKRHQDKTSKEEKPKEELKPIHLCNNIKLIDLGFTKIFGEIKPTPIGKKTTEVDPKKKDWSPTAKTYIPYFVSPEQLAGVYEEKTDVWAAGVLLYMMISGTSPFTGNSMSEIFKNVLKKKVSFHGSLWKSVSDELKELLKKMLCEIGARFSANQVLDHDWVRNGNIQKSDFIKDFDIEGFKKLSDSYYIKKDIVNLLVDNIKDEEIIKIKDDLDAKKEQDGLVSLKDFKEAFNKIGEINDKIKIDNILSKFQLDEGTKFDFAQYLMESSDRILYYRIENLRRLLRAIDYDNTGKISKNKIISLLKRENLSEETIENIIKECDLIGDDECNYNEFLAMMDKTSNLPYRNINSETIPNESK